MQKAFTPGEISKICEEKRNLGEGKRQKAVAKVCDKITRYLARKKLDAVVFKLSHDHKNCNERGVLYIRANYSVYSDDVARELSKRGFCVEYNHSNPHGGTYTVSVPKDANS